MRMFIFLLSIISCQFSFAQTWEEWFQQKQTAIKRLEEQIAANKVFIEYAKKGFKIVSSGLNTIRDIKQGDFDLHVGFIDSLKIVNPQIKKWAKVAGIIAMQLHIIKTSKQALIAVRESAQFTPDELDYCKNVFDHLIEECMRCIDELLMVITSGELEMTDDDRLSRIDQIYSDMQDKFSFTGSFSNEMSTLAVQRLSEQIEINYARTINAK